MKLLAVIAARRGNATERAFWQRTLQEGKIEEDDLDEAMACLVGIAPPGPTLQVRGLGLACGVPAAGCALLVRAATIIRFGDARNARSFGAEGIGLCRTEHMFFHKERIPIVRQITRRKAALSKISFQVISR